MLRSSNPSARVVVLRGLVATLALAVFWAAASGHWARGFRATTNSALALLGYTGRVGVIAAPAGSADVGIGIGDTTLVLCSAGCSTSSPLRIDSFTFGFLPVAVFAVLAMAAGRPALRSGRMAAGLLGILALESATLALTVARHAALHPALGLFTADPAWAPRVELGYRVFVNPTGFEYVLPAVVWLLSSVGATAPAAAKPARGRGGGVRGVRMS